MKRNIIIDGHNYLSIAMFRAQSNIMKDNPERLEEWLPGATKKLFLTMCRKLQREFLETSNYVIVWDSPGGTSWRKKLVPSYKSTRKSHSFIRECIKIGHEVADELMMTNIEIEEAEADDIIYTYCREFSAPDVDNTIISRDQDMIQIVQSGYANRVYDPVSKKNMEIPEYDIVEYKCLVGDSSDCIPGINGIGPAKAKAILLGGGGIRGLHFGIQEELDTYRKIISLKENPNYKNNAKNLKALLERMYE